MPCNDTSVKDYAKVYSLLGLMKKWMWLLLLVVADGTEIDLN